MLANLWRTSTVATVAGPVAFSPSLFLLYATYVQKVDLAQQHSHCAKEMMEP